MPMKSPRNKKGTGRLEVTKIINRFLHRDESGKHVMNTSDPIFREISFQSHKGYHDRGHQGVGYDEAKAKCGNCADSLREGVTDGRIKTTGDPEQFKNMMFYFPQNNVGGRVEAGNELSTELGKNIDPEQLMIFNNAVKAMIPDDTISGVGFGSTPNMIADATTMELPGGGQLHLVNEAKNSEKAHQLLEETQDTLHKQLLNCEKVLGQVCGIDGMPERLRESIDALTLAQEEATAVEDDTKFLLKFRKDKLTKTAATRVAYEKQTLVVEQAQDDLAAACRVTKAHMQVQTGGRK